MTWSVGEGNRRGGWKGCQVRAHRLGDPPLAALALKFLTGARFLVIFLFCRTLPVHRCGGRRPVRVAVRRFSHVLTQR